MSIVSTVLSPCSESGGDAGRDPAQYVVDAGNLGKAERHDRAGRALKLLGACGTQLSVGQVEVRGAITEEHDAELAHRGFARGGVNADVGVDAAEDDRVDAA